MKRIKLNSEIKVGDTIVWEQSETLRFFKHKKTTVIIESFDEIDFWCIGDNKKLLESYQNYRRICIGNPEQNSFNKFYKK